MLLFGAVSKPERPTVIRVLWVIVNLLGLAVVGLKYQADSVRMVDNREAGDIQRIFGRESYQNLFILRETKWMIRLRFGQPVADLIWNLVFLCMDISGINSTAKNFAGAAVFASLSLCYSIYKFCCDKKATEKAFKKESLSMQQVSPNLESVI